MINLHKVQSDLIMIRGRELQTAIDKFNLFSKENRLSLTAAEILAEIEIENSPESFHKLIGKFIPFVKSEKMFGELLQILNNLWNLAPHKSLGGLSPLQVLKKAPRQIKSSSNDSPNWVKVTDLLLGIQGNFQREIYDILDKKSVRTKKAVIDNIHHLFQRYFYTALESKPNSASFSDIFWQEIKNKKIKMPEKTQIILRLCKTPARTKNPHRQIRMSLGAETSENFPIVKDLNLKNDELNTFYQDKFYNKILSALSRHLKRERSPQKVLAALWNFLIVEWWTRNRFINSVFGLDDFSQLLFSAVANSASDWSLTDTLFNILIKKAERKGFNLSYSKLITHLPKGLFFNPKNQDEEGQAVLFYLLGIEYCRYFLTPLTTYFPIFDLYYYDPIDLEDEISGFEEKEGFGQSLDEWVSKPPSEFRLRPLGKIIWQEAFK